MNDKVKELVERKASELHELHKKLCTRMFSWNMNNTTWEQLDGVTRLKYRTAARKFLNDPDLALKTNETININGKEAHIAIPLAEALKEE